MINDVFSGFYHLDDDRVRLSFTEEVGIYFDTTSMLGRFLCLAKFDFSDRIDTRIDSIRSSILNERKFIFVTWRVDSSGSNIFLFFRVEFVGVDIGDKFSNWRSN